MNPLHDRCDELGLTRDTLWDYIDSVGDMVSVDRMNLDSGTEFLAVSVIRRAGAGTLTGFVHEPSEALEMAKAIVGWAEGAAR